LIVASVRVFAAATMTLAARRPLVVADVRSARKCAPEAALKRLLARRKSNSLRDVGVHFGNRDQDDARWLQWCVLRNRQSGGGPTFAPATLGFLKTSLG
jgi:hypothetical protein